MHRVENYLHKNDTSVVSYQVTLHKPMCYRVPENHLLYFRYKVRKACSACAYVPGSMLLLVTSGPTVGKYMYIMIMIGFEE